jgi:hypothetical protein
VVESGGEALLTFTFGTVRFDAIAEAYRFTVAHRRSLIRCSISLAAVEELSDRRVDRLKPLALFDDNRSGIRAIVREQYFRQGACRGSLTITPVHVICSGTD